MAKPDSLDKPAIELLLEVRSRLLQSADTAREFAKNAEGTGRDYEAQALKIAADSMTYCAGFVSAVQILMDSKSDA